MVLVEIQAEPLTVPDRVEEEELEGQPDSVAAFVAAVKDGLEDTDSVLLPVMVPEVEPVTVLLRVAQGEGDPVPLVTALGLANEDIEFDTVAHPLRVTILAVKEELIVRVGEALLVDET